MCCSKNRNGAIDTGRCMHRGPEIHGISGLLQGGPLPCYIICGIMGLSINGRSFSLGANWWKKITLLKKRPHKPMFITIIGARRGFPENKPRAALEFPIFRSSGWYHLWRRVTEKSEHVFWGQICNLANWKRVVWFLLVGNASHVKNDKIKSTKPWKSTKSIKEGVFTKSTIF